jgi:hypothetical protein
MSNMSNSFYYLFLVLAFAAVLTLGVFGGGGAGLAFASCMISHSR